ncbi:PIH1 domain-containing protein 2 [Dryobates pubescens]|uniref:PIH1 domain-containing protein 2 n=1 Tax=Dryobates pubescens TaxID=118200 RepID=UPI0023B990F5|nr:PIH1 domain-containing protein 2 [Dryobates pubescens]
MAGAALAGAAQLWSLLDEMLESDPQAYGRFLRQQRAEAERFCAPPEPHLCLRARPAVRARPAGLGPPRLGAGSGGEGRVARPQGAQPPLGLLQDVIGGPLFINVCGWKRVPAPKAAADPTPVSVGRLEEASGEGELCRIIDVAYNPAVLQRAEKPEETEHLIHLTLKLIEEQCNLLLPYSYTMEPFKLKGSLAMMQQRLEGRQRPAPQLSQNTKELSLDQLLQAVQAEDCSNAPVLLEEESVTQSRRPLIEEITSPEIREEPAVPAYEIITVRDAKEKPLQLELKIWLPKVGSVSECDLSISKDDITMEVPGQYQLQLDLPELVDEEGATAVFHRGKGLLFVTLPVARPGP